ncbi:OmpA family protein [Reichenbachiella sp. MALMAid0571]|uniref:OmpA family protein n=1 Tax=Reichenbachiella sp. MALMAid0571 TaxID=3143939 RepID=UPI0032DF3173
MRLTIYAILFLSHAVFNSSFAQKPVNIISLELGSKMISVPPSMVEITERKILAKYSPGALFDKSPYVWSSKNTQFPFEFVVELAEEYKIRQLIFNNKCEFYPGIETKNVRVEMSETGKDTGFNTVGEYELKKETVNIFDVPNTKARWIKLVILDNYGNNERVQLAEFEAIGIPANKIKRTVQVDGVWHTNWQDITFEQEGESFTGSYVYTNGQSKIKGKVNNGKISENSIEFDWNEKKVTGTAKLYLNQEGNRISGIWKNNDNPRDFNLWTMTRDVVESKPIEYSEPVEEEEIEEVIEKEEVAIVEVEAKKEVLPIAKPIVKIGDDEVKVGSTIILKNVFFDLGKSTVTPSSYDELDKLYGYLNDNPSTDVTINGHTDKLGDPKKNLILSQQRADAIMEYLTNKGVNKKRISTIGKGDTETICPTPCKENRRVDFVLVEK